jgi:hypothetical protein
VTKPLRNSISDETNRLTPLIGVSLERLLESRKSLDHFKQTFNIVVSKHHFNAGISGMIRKFL